jgi:hypothetical protein
MRALSCLAVVLPALALADPAREAVASPERAAPEAAPRGCSLDVLTRESLVRSGDIEVSPGEAPRDVVSLNGRVRIKAGAVVKGVVALGGEVVVEEGAVVKGDAVALGGKLDVAPGAIVEGNATSIGEGITRGDGARIGGNRASIRTELNGANLAAVVLAGLGSLLGSCDVEVRVRD